MTAFGLSRYEEGHPFKAKQLIRIEEAIPTLRFPALGSTQPELERQLGLTQVNSIYADVLGMPENQPFFERIPFSTVSYRRLQARSNYVPSGGAPLVWATIEI